MRVFATGATRDDNDTKLSYASGLSPEVLRGYMQYLAKHRVQADGKLRAWDNWKRGIPPQAYMDSLLRHTVDLWLNTNQWETKEAEVERMDLLYAIMFNAMGLVYESLVDMGQVIRFHAGDEQAEPTHRGEEAL